ncbi:DUF1593 domain-containing protein [Prevotella sp.]|uniref:DUF1593 domain-containing protein n=1 Tax=Prevotella sp. TaxID=59823 RepID=UPI00264A0A6D|nr:DUF1593 domain-containing protein [Prevotella sp.]MDN5554865.1 DUF1593 domain-containing protein [Prevotella sp.]
MKKYGIILLLLLSNLCLSAQTRMIVMSDIGGSDPDDTQSLVHLFVSLDQVELEGFISQHAWVPYGQGAIKLINNMINSYEAVLPNLKVHSAAYPSAAYLRSIVKQGQPEAAMHGVDTGKDSEGSEWIIKIIDRDDPRPVWISAWSGLSTLAQALWKVSHTRTKNQVDEFVRKIRVYDVLGQDDAGAWIVKNFPNIIYIRNKKIYGWAPSDKWTNDNVQNVGLLGTLYPNRIWAIEGDSPSFMYCLNNGLNVPEHPEYGGWGGRFATVRIANIPGMDWVKKNGLDETQYAPYYMIPSASEGANAILRWKDDIYNDFAARMQWTVCSNFKDANHHPVVVMGNNKGKEILELKVNAGQIVVLNAAKSYDPDHNKLTYDWTYYKEPSTYNGNIVLNTSMHNVCNVIVPKDAANHTIHIILRVVDNGVPSLTSYKRIILNVLP